MTGLVYTAGRSLAYLVLGILMVASLLTAPGVSLILQERMNQILGPALILAGVLLLDLIRLPSRGGGISGGLAEQSRTMGNLGRRTARAGVRAVVLSDFSRAVFRQPDPVGLEVRIKRGSALGLWYRDCSPSVRICDRVGNRSECSWEDVSCPKPL